MLDQLDWDQEAMEFLEIQYDEYVSRLFAALNEDDCGPDSTESGLPFCGCETCYVRETFAFLMPRFIDLYVKGLITLQHANEGEGDGVQLVQGRGVVESDGPGDGDAW